MILNTVCGMQSALSADMAGQIRIDVLTCLRPPVAWTNRTMRGQRQHITSRWHVCSALQSESSIAATEEALLQDPIGMTQHVLGCTKLQQKPAVPCSCCADNIPEQSDSLEPLGPPVAAVEEAYLKGGQALCLLQEALAKAATLLRLNNVACLCRGRVPAQPGLQQHSRDCQSS